LNKSLYCTATKNLPIVEPPAISRLLDVGSPQPQ
jgi:hypothetical protein